MYDIQQVPCHHLFTHIAYLLTRNFQSATLHLVLRLRGGGSTVLVVRLSDGKTFDLVVWDIRTVSELKDAIRKKSGISVDEQVIVWNNTILKDGKNTLATLVPEVNAAQVTCLRMSGSMPSTSTYEPVHHYHLLPVGISRSS